MGLPFYSVLDGAACGPNLEIRETGLVLTCNLSGTDGNGRKARAMLAKQAAAGRIGYEVAYYDNGSGDTLTGIGLAVGICTTLSTLNTGVGVDGSSYGYRVADGGLYQTNVALLSAAALPASPPKSYIGVVADLTNSKLEIYNNGGLLATQAISPATGGRVYYPCGSVGSATAYGSNLYFNFGQREFAYPLPGVTGWFNAAASPSGIYIGPVGNEAYASGHADSPADKNFLPVWLNSNDCIIEKTNTTWLWTNRSASATFSFIDIDNSFGVYTDLVRGNYRDAPVYFLCLENPDDTLANVAHTIATAYVDHIEMVGETTIRVYLKNKRSTLNRPYQRKIFPPFTDPGVAGRPYPSIIGAARSVDVGSFLVDSPTRYFQLSDTPITNIGDLRDKGNALDANATPPQFAPTPDLLGVIPSTLPLGKFTADVSTCGPQSTYPGAPDVLNGIGSNWDTSWTGPNGVIPSPIAPPTGWTYTNVAIGGTTSSAVRIGTPSGYPHQMVQMTSNRQLSQIGPSAEFSLKTTSSPLRAGKTYIVRFHMYDFQNGGGLPGGGLAVLSAFANYTNSGQWISPYIQGLTGGYHSDIPMSLVYTVPAGLDRQLYFTVFGAGGQTCSVTWYGVTVEEVGTALTNVPLVGIGFQDWMMKVLTTKGGLATTEWSQADCTALDAAYPGAPLGACINTPVTLDSVMQLPMDSVCGVVTEDRFGVLRFKRLTNPVGQTPLATYTEQQIDYPIQIDFDEAKGLTQTIGSKRNTTPYSDSDFVTDYTLVPAAFRTQLKRNSRVIQVCNTQLFQQYQFASLAQPLDTIFDNDTTAYLELTRVNGFFKYGSSSSAPVFITFTINYDGVPPEYLFGDIIKIDYTSPQPPTFRPYYQQVFHFVSNVAVIGTRLSPGKNKLQIIAWTPYPVASTS